MQKQVRFILSALILGAFLLSACSGAIPTQAGPDDSPGVNANEVLDNGTNANDANANGNVNSNDDNSNANANGNSNDDNSNANGNGNDDNSNANGNGNGAPSGPEQEAFGVVVAITQDSITIGNVTYKIANFTEFKTLIAVGDQVKIHVIVNADGSLTIREIEKTTGTGVGNDNSNTNGNSNGNSNDDNGNGGGGNGNDDNGNGGGGNGNDDGNDNGGDDDNDNGGGNGNG